jgi:outer membrane receptor protein involved in Fe transport
LAKAVRAPNISELFTGQSQTFPTGLTDPCEGVGPTGDPANTPAGTGDRCRADPGIAKNIALNGVFTLNQADKQGISGFNGGNPNLGPETGHTRTLGVVIAPRSIPALRNLSLSVDYWHITVDNAISTIPRQTILNTCFEQGLAATCALITRFQSQTGSSSPGAIEFINAFEVNIASLTRAGIDAVLQYRTGLGSFMGSPLNMNARIAYTHLLKGFDIPLEGQAPDRRAGEIDNPRDKFDATLGFDNRLWGLSFHGTYIG